MKARPLWADIILGIGAVLALYVGYSLLLGLVTGGIAIPHTLRD